MDLVLVVVVGWVAAAWGVVMALSPLLQIRRMLLTRSARDVSVGYFGLLTPGFALWVVYGLARHDLALAVPNTLAAIVALIVIAVAYRFRRRRPDSPTEPGTDGRQRAWSSAAPTPTAER